VVRPGGFMGNTPILKIYKKLLLEYGRQGWWPLASRGGYHPGDYRKPETREECFEIILGAVLTQNTTWKNASSALESLLLSVDTPEKLLRLEVSEISKLIRKSGYHNQKAVKIKEVTSFLLKNDYLGDDLEKTPLRNELLAIWGIGPETADSILLYAYSFPSFVVDAYTKRIFSRIGLIDFSSEYGEIQKTFQENLSRKDEIYNEYHALIVRHAKTLCSKKKPECGKCFLKTECRYPAGDHSDQPPEKNTPAIRSDSSGGNTKNV